MDARDHVTIADRPWHVGPRIAQRPALAEPLQHTSFCAVGNPIATGILVAQQRNDRRDRYVEHHAGANLRMGRALHGPNRHLDAVLVATHLLQAAPSPSASTGELPALSRMSRAMSRLLMMMPPGVVNVFLRKR